MTDKYIERMVDTAKNLSRLYGNCWLFSNGEKLDTAVNAYEYCELKDGGYWVAMLFGDGHQIDL